MHPYPSEEQKKQLAQDTGLTILQVNNWITMRDMVGELASLSALSVRQFFFPGKSSYLNWPQELPLSDFNAPYSVDSISITPVTKA
ncbi:hypothetical protein E2320_021343 [Naja naja]|nr:hypothetical protein E2320_021343 [Naja naja]